MNGLRKKEMPLWLFSCLSLLFSYPKGGPQGRNICPKGISHSPFGHILPKGWQTRPKGERSEYAPKEHAQYMPRRCPAGARTTWEERASRFALAPSGPFRQKSGLKGVTLLPLAPKGQRHILCKHQQRAKSFFFCSGDKQYLTSIYTLWAPKALYIAFRCPLYTQGWCFRTNKGPSFTCCCCPSGAILASLFCRRCPFGARA